MNDESPSKECEKCGKDLSSFDESGGKKPCPNCGSKKRVKYLQAVSEAHGSALVDVKMFSPLSKHLKKLMEFHSEPVNGLKERENSLVIILFTHIFMDSYLYESFVDSDIFSDEKYQKESQNVYNERWKLRGEILKKDPECELEKAEISLLEAKYFYLLRKYLGVDFYDVCSDNIEDFRRLIDLRNDITHFKEYEVTDIASDDRLKRKIDLETANKLKENAFSIANEIDSLIETDPG